MQLPLGIAPPYPDWASQARVALNAAARVIGKALFQALLTIKCFVPLHGTDGARLNTGRILATVTR